jgi:hypothetical protein
VEISADQHLLGVVHGGQGRGGRHQGRQGQQRDREGQQEPQQRNDGPLRDLVPARGITGAGLRSGAGPREPGFHGGVANGHNLGGSGCGAG